MKPFTVLPRYYFDKLTILWFSAMRIVLSYKFLFYMASSRKIYM